MTKEIFKRKPLTLEHKKKISLAKSGKSSWNKGIPLSKENKMKYSLNHVITGLPKKFILLRDNFTCQICGLKDEEVLEIDHIFPASSGGKNIPENLITLCANCHRRKTNREHRERFKGIDVRKFWKINSTAPND